MNKTFYFLPAIALVSVLSACAVQHDKTDVGFGLAYRSNIVDNADGTFTAAAEASLARGRVSGASGLTQQDAEEKCASLKKQVKIIKNETNSHYLVNGVSRLTFRCE